MIEITFDESAFLADVRRELDALERELGDASFGAARAGVWAAQQDHPYTDRTQQLTNTAHPERDPDERSGALMVWEMPYASYVDSGTSRSRPYPYTPIAMRAAQASLTRLIHEAIARWAARSRSA